MLGYVGKRADGYAGHQPYKPAQLPAGMVRGQKPQGSHWFSLQHESATGFPGCNGYRRRAGEELSPHRGGPHARACHPRQKARQAGPGRARLSNLLSLPPVAQHRAAVPTSDRVNHLDSKTCEDQTASQADLDGLDTTLLPPAWNYAHKASRLLGT